MYPPARRSDHVDTYFNTPVPDPYRWMEDVDSPEVEAWVTAQNQLTRSVLDAVPGRATLQTRLLALTDFERVSAPTVRNGRFIYAHNTGLQNQAVLLWQDGPTGEPHLLLDPNTLSPDGTVALAGIALSNDGTHLAYALAEAGSDWITWHVKQIGTGPQHSSPDLPDRVTHSKFSGASWLPDTSGFVYSGYGLPEDSALQGPASPTPDAVIPTEVEGPASPATEAVLPTEAQRPASPTLNTVIPTEVEGPASLATEAVIPTEAQRGEKPPASAPAQPTETPGDLKSTQHFHKVFLHLLGTPQSADPVLYQRPDDGELLLGGHVTDDGRYLLLTASKGHTNQLHALALDATLRPTGPLIPIAPTADARYDPIDTDADTLWLHTTSEAPNGRVVSLDLTDPDRAHWQTILPETTNNLDSVSMVANTLIATCLADAKSEARLFTPIGTPLGPLTLPAIGTVSAFSGRRTDIESFVTFTNFTTPPTVLRLDLASPVIPTGAAGEVERPASRSTTEAVISTEAQTGVPDEGSSLVGLERSGETSVFAPAEVDISSTSRFVVIPRQSEEPASLPGSPAPDGNTRSTTGSPTTPEAPPSNPRISPLDPAQAGVPHPSQPHREGWDVSRPIRVLTPFRSPHLTFDPASFTTTQVFFTSKDGTRVPMFLTHRRGLPLDGNNPTLLYAYGGFNISLLPTFSPSYLLWMELGGIFAQPNLRGGGEYGEAWHEAGTRLKKQNVFDDFIAAAEYLIAHGYTSPQKLAIEGGSNGGLLVAAVELQRPELFAAAVAHVGVFDMLRFDQFTIGYAWKPDYGSPSSNEREFRALLRYSPVHNTRPNVAYPPTLVLTADHDDRVFPAHSFKFTAAMQHALTPEPVIPTEVEGPAALPGTLNSTGNTRSAEHPTLIRVEVRAGHGAGMPLSKRIDQTVDVYLFLARFLHLTLPR